MLAGLLREHRGPLVADLRRFYGLPLSRVREEMTLREFAACVANLPPDAAVWRSVDPDAMVTPELRMLQFIEYRLQILAWQQTKDGQSDYPQHYPEPVAITAAEREARAEVEAQSAPEMPDRMDLDELKRRLPMQAVPRANG